MVRGLDIKCSIKLRARINQRFFINFIIISGTLTLLLVYTFHIQSELLKNSLALLCTSFVPGYALLSIIAADKYLSNLEILILSYVLSYIYTALAYFAILPLDATARPYVLLSSYVILCAITTLKHRKKLTLIREASFCKKIDVLALLMALGFYIISFMMTYPLGIMPVTDMPKHYATSVVLGRTPELHLDLVYLLAHLYVSAFLCISGASVVVTQTTLIMLNLILPLAFYVATKRLLGKVNSKIPSLATLFWALFTNGTGGFAWLYFAKLKLSEAYQSQFQLLVNAADKTYNGTIYGILGLWFVPATISFVLLFVLISMFVNRTLPRKTFFALFAVTFAGMYLTHVAEAVVFATLLALYDLLFECTDLRIDESLASAIVGFLIVVMVYLFSSQIFSRLPFDESLLISIVIPLVALSFVWSLRHLLKPRINKFSEKSLSALTSANRSLILIVISILIYGYVIALFSSTSLVESFHVWQVSVVGSVPWFLYPNILGINGLIGLFSLYFVFEEKKYRQAYAFIVFFLIFAFLTGRVISLINQSFFNTEYREIRFIWFINIPLALLAPILLLVISNVLNVNLKKNLIKYAIITSLVGIIVTSGISTTFLNVEYWHQVASYSTCTESTWLQTLTGSIPTKTEMEAVNFLKIIFDKDPKAWLVTMTGSSDQIVDFATPPDKLGLKQLLYTAYTPEMAFTILYRHPAYSHPYIYLHSRDTACLVKYSDRFLAQYLWMLPMIFSNSEVKIYNVSKLSPLQTNSDNVLILPLDKSFLSEQNLYVIYSILSQNLYNYTTAYDLDDKALNAKTIILPFDPPQGNVIKDSFQEVFNQPLSLWSISEGNWQVSNGGLLCGETGRYGKGIILSPVVSAENFTASFKVRPISGTATVPNYVGLIYSWKDSKNFRYADILFNDDFYIYVLFRIVINGVEQVVPNWPGIKTDIKWNFGDEYNITVTVNGTLNQITVNGKNYLSTDLENIPGRIGFCYYRFYQVSFDDFSLTYNVLLNLRPIEDHLTYLESGGKLIILNTNGYNYFANSIFSVENSTLNAEKIEIGKEILNLPTEITMPKLTLKNSTTSVLSRYIGLDSENPFIVKQNFGNGELFYVNIKPIIEALRNDEAFMYYYLLGRLLEDLNLPKIRPNFVLSTDGYMKEIQLKNDINIETASLIFPLKTALKQLEIKTSDRTFTFLNVTSIKVENYSKLLVETKNLTISDGQGFYVPLKLNSVFTVKPCEGMLSLEIVTGEAKHHITQAEQISITPNGSIQLLARTPKVIASEVTFIEFYTFGSLNWRTRTYGQNLNVNGTTSFQIELSDHYTMVKNVELSGSFEREPPMVMFNELSTIPTAIFWIALTLPIFIGVIFIFTLKQQPHAIQDDKGQSSA